MYFETWRGWSGGIGVATMPANDKNVALFIIAQLQEGKSCHVIQSIVAAIKWNMQILGFEDTLGSLTKNMVECSKRIAKPVRTPKEPITGDILREMFDIIGRREANLLNLRKFTILLLSFAGFLRFDEVSKLRLDDIQFYRTHMSLFLEGSKTDIYREGHTVVISRVPASCCPVDTLARFLELGKIAKGDTFLFRAVTRLKGGRYKFRSPNVPLSYTTCRTGALELVAKVGLDPKVFGLHSARSGGATAAANRGVPDRLFKRHGRWVSEKAKDCYIKDNLCQLLLVSQNLGL